MSYDALIISSEMYHFSLGVPEAQGLGLHSPTAHLFLTLPGLVRPIQPRRRRDWTAGNTA